MESAVTTTYCYDALGRVTEKYQKQGAVTDTTDSRRPDAEARGSTACYSASSGTILFIGAMFFSCATASVADTDITPTKQYDCAVRVIPR